MATKPPLQKILTGILQTENENKQNHKRLGMLNLKKRPDK
jgi:hypothetical protein